MSRRWAVLSVVALAAAVAGFLLLFERHEETVETGPRGAARFNDYLALERLVVELGVPVTSSRNPLRLPPTDHVLLLVTPVRPPAETYAERLVAWVEAGGHLVATPEGWPAATTQEADEEDAAADGEEDGSEGGDSGSGREGSGEGGGEENEEEEEAAAGPKLRARYKPGTAGAGDPAPRGTEGPAAEAGDTTGGKTAGAEPARHAPRRKPPRQQPGRRGPGLPGPADRGSALREPENAQPPAAAPPALPPAAATEIADPAAPEAPTAAAEDPTARPGADGGSRFLDLLLGDDPLFDRLGVVVAPAIRGAPGLIELRPAAAANPLRVEVTSDLYLQPLDPGAVLHAAGSPRAAVLLQLSLGDGRLTLLADGGPLTNARLGEHDHARLAWALLAPEAVPAGVWVADWRVAPGLLALLLRHAGAALAAAAVLLALWLWKSAARFGPPLPSPSGERRSLREHVEAAGGFLWRQGEGDELVAASRRAVARRAEVHFPGWARLPRREQVARLAEVSRLSPGAVARALAEDVPAGADAHHFTRTVSILELIRRSL